MHIMTTNGWRELSPKTITPATSPMSYNGIPAPYVGAFPSAAICDLFNRQCEQMKYFDHGIRMVYSKADRRVEVDNATPAHPILNPPKGF